MNFFWSRLLGYAMALVGLSLFRWIRDMVRGAQEASNTPPDARMLAEGKRVLKKAYVDAQEAKEALQKGMTHAEVRTVLGSPWKTQEKGSYLYYFYFYGKLECMFVEDVLKFITFYPDHSPRLASPKIKVDLHG